MAPSAQDKKWFVYIVDHHEGPFSLEEIQKRMQAQPPQIVSSHYVWSDGMADWRPMNEVSEFDELVRMAPAPAPTLSLLMDSSEAKTQMLEPEAKSDPQKNIEFPAGLTQAETSLREVPVLEAAPSLSQISIQESAADQASVAPQISKTEPTTSSVISPSSSSAVLSEVPTSLEVPIELAPTPSSTKKSLKASKQERSSRLGGIGKTLGLIFFSALLLGHLFLISGLSDGLFQNQFLMQYQTAMRLRVQPLVFQWVETYPVVGEFLSPISRPPHLSDADFLKLRTAVFPTYTGSGDSVSPQISIVAAHENPAEPTLYVAANLPGELKLTLQLEGQPDTLLNQLEYSAQHEVILKDRVGKTSPLRGKDGAPIPKGNYTVYVYESADHAQGASQEVMDLLKTIPPVTAKLPKSLPRGIKLLGSASFFLGGEKDQAYLSRLKEYHDKVREKAQGELLELKQLFATLESQLNSTVDQLTQLKSNVKGAKPSPSTLKKWKKFSAQWSALQAQLKTTSDRWADPLLLSGLFYGVIYSSVRASEKEISALHSIQDSFFEGRFEPSMAELSLSQTTSAAQSALSQLKQKLDHVEQLAPYPSGLPKREGLE